MNLTREAITRSAFNRSDLPEGKAAKAVEVTFEIIKKPFEDGEDVVISGIGKFCVKDEGMRPGGYSETGERLMLAERRVHELQVFAGAERKTEWWPGGDLEDHRAG
jgi:integration host factor subunit alpha